MPKVYDVEEKRTRTMVLDTNEVVELIREHYELDENAVIELTSTDPDLDQPVTVTLRHIDGPMASTDGPVLVRVTETSYTRHHQQRRGVTSCD